MQPRLVIIGNFDGVHLGHQHVLRSAAEKARVLALEPVVLTFDPHPAKVLGRSAPPVLTALPRKIELIERVAPELRVHVEPFDLRFASQTPEVFAESFLKEKLHAKRTVVGQNFRFGKGRAGNFDTLTELGRANGFVAESHPLVGDEEGPWSSTRIRALVAKGDVTAAKVLLGRPHMVSGTVVPGDQRGRTIGFPTANLEGVGEELPENGVYAVLVDVASRENVRKLAKGVANIGVRPTVENAALVPRVEVFLLDFSGDLYGANLRVHLIERLRPEQKFGGLAELKAQIERDVGSARRLLDAYPLRANESAFWF